MYIGDFIKNILEIFKELQLNKNDRIKNILGIFKKGLNNSETKRILKQNNIMKNLANTPF